MKVFVVIAALMAALAAAAVAVPLLRARQHRVSAALAALLVAGAAAGLYPLWSNWDWSAPVQGRAAGPDIGAMVAKLEQQLREQPSDLKGWLMLGRSYLVLQRVDDAIAAYEQAYRIGNSADAAMGLGEALSLRAGGEITPQAARLFEEALNVAPTNPKALLYGGFAAAANGKPDLAKSRWQTLKDMNPPPQIVEMLDARIAELGAVPAAAGPSAAPAGTSAASAGTVTSPGDSAIAQATVNISLAPRLQARLKADTVLFVFARDPGKPGPPLAAKRLTSAAIGTQVRLTAADSMMPGRVLSRGRRVSIMARVSFSGQPTPAAGDLYGEVSYEVGRDAVRNLVIDHVE